MVGKDPLILVLYVDDIFITGVERLIVGFKKILASTFEMKYIGLIHYFVGNGGVVGTETNCSGTGKV